MIKQTPKKLKLRKYSFWSNLFSVLSHIYNVCESDTEYQEIDNYSKFGSHAFLNAYFKLRMEKNC